MKCTTPDFAADDRSRPVRSSLAAPEERRIAASPISSHALATLPAVPEFCVYLLLQQGAAARAAS